MEVNQDILRAGTAKAVARLMSFAQITCKFCDADRQTCYLTKIRQKRPSRGIKDRVMMGRKHHTIIWTESQTAFEEGPKFLNLIFKIQHISYHCAKFHNDQPSDL